MNIKIHLFSILHFIIITNVYSQTIQPTCSGSDITVSDFKMICSKNGIQTTKTTTIPATIEANTQCSIQCLNSNEVFKFECNRRGNLVDNNDYIYPNGLNYLVNYHLSSMGIIVLACPSEITCSKNDLEKYHLKVDDIRNSYNKDKNFALECNSPVYRLNSLAIGKSAECARHSDNTVGWLVDGKKLTESPYNGKICTLDDTNYIEITHIINSRIAFVHCPSYTPVIERGRQFVHKNEDCETYCRFRHHSFSGITTTGNLRTFCPSEDTCYAADLVMLDITACDDKHLDGECIDLECREDTFSSKKLRADVESPVKAKCERGITGNPVNDRPTWKLYSGDGSEIRWEINENVCVDYCHLGRFVARSGFLPVSFEDQTDVRADDGFQYKISKLTKVDLGSTVVVHCDDGQMVRLQCDDVGTNKFVNVDTNEDALVSQQLCPPREMKCNRAELESLDGTSSAFKECIPELDEGRFCEVTCDSGYVKTNPFLESYRCQDGKWHKSWTDDTLTVIGEDETSLCGAHIIECF